MKLPAFLPHQHGLDLRAYPFPSPVLKACDGILPRQQLLDLSLQSAPPDLLVANAQGEARELIFISATDRAALSHWAAEQHIPTLQRPDLWADLLEPFLDTEFDEASQEQTRQRLQSHGLSPAEIAYWRQRVKGPMLRYNALLWEWVHLGLYDLLCAMSFPMALRARAQAFCALYVEAMEIALRYRKAR